MVSKVKYDTLPRISRRTVRREPWKFIFLALAVVVVFVTGGSAIFPLFVLFISLGMVRYIGSAVRQLVHSQHKVAEEESVEPRQLDV